MGRREQREQIFKLLFRQEFHSLQEMDQQVRLFFEDEEVSGISEKDMNYIIEKYQKIRELVPELDQYLDEKVEGWNTARMGKVELTVLRLAVYEMLHDEDVPEGVAINEAVEIAKTYGQEGSGAFVNAVLAKFVKQGDQNS
ncbi:MAG: transcription antitermination factor NusB [Lachnospiraceae bacterium]|nr:transcription antitermination factor NusB [Lachnospiraceae bacterium]